MALKAKCLLLDCCVHVFKMSDVYPNGLFNIEGPWHFLSVCMALVVQGAKY